jgi:hypothetical protein
MSSSISIATTDGSISEDHLHCSDAESTFEEFEAASSLRLSDQTLLKQAFGIAVHGSKWKAKDWRHERESQFVQEHSLSGETDPKKVAKNRSYSSKIRSLLRKITIASTKSVTQSG